MASWASMCSSYGHLGLCESTWFIRQTEHRPVTVHACNPDQLSAQERLKGGKFCQVPDACSGRTYGCRPLPPICLAAAQDDTHVEGRTQRLRQSAGCLETAVAAFKLHAKELKFVLTLGDIIDGNVTEDKTSADFDVIASTFDPLVSTSCF